MIGKSAYSPSLLSQLPHPPTGLATNLSAPLDIVFEAFSSVNEPDSLDALENLDIALQLLEQVSEVPLLG